MYTTNTYPGYMKYCVVLHAFMHRIMERKGRSRRFMVCQVVLVFYLNNSPSALHSVCYNNQGNLIMVFMHELMTFPGLEINFSDISMTRQDYYVKRINPKWIDNPGDLANMENCKCLFVCTRKNCPHQ